MGQVGGTGFTSRTACANALSLEDHIRGLWGCNARAGNRGAEEGGADRRPRVWSQGPQTGIVEWSLHGQSHAADSSRRFSRSQGEDRHEKVHAGGRGTMFSKMEARGPPLLIT